MRWLTLGIVALFLISGSHAQFPVGDYYNPEIPINTGDVFVWDIVNATFNSGDPYFIDQSAESGEFSILFSDINTFLGYELEGPGEGSIKLY